jgi:acyltransferase
METAASPAAPRISMIDTARFYGMALVYYGHVVERMMYLGSATAAQQYKVIYSFHMPLFFVLAGFIAKEAVFEAGLSDFLKNCWTSRLVPFLFFNVVLALLALVVPRDFPPFHLENLGDFVLGAARTLVDLPIFNIPTWFLMALVSVEFLHYAAFRYLKASDVRIGVAVPVFYLAGYALTREVDFFHSGKPFSGNVWFVHEAVVMYAFYLLGVLLRRRRFLAGPVSFPLVAGGAVLALAAVLCTYDLNHGPFRLIQAVIILAGGHGHIFWFPFTAIAGSLLILLLARLTPAIKPLTFMGRNALILFGLNGVFYHSVNGPVAAWVMTIYPGSSWVVFATGAGLAAVSLALGVPGILWLTNRLPWAIGKGRAACRRPAAG